MHSSQVANAIRKLCPTVDLPESALVLCGKLLKEQLQLAIKRARVLARHAKRKTISCDDINQALGLLGHEAIYGSQRFENQRLVSLEGQDTYFAEDVVVGTSEVHDTIVECPPVGTQIHCHWLAIEGSQPQVPENEPLPTARERKERSGRGIPNKDSVSRKRKSASNTVQTVTGGMVQGGVELRLPVEHALTAEQQAYYEQIQHLIEAVSSDTGAGSDQNEFTHKIEKTVHDLQNDAALQPLIPYLIRFAEQRIYTSMENVSTLNYTLQILHSLVRNRHVGLCLYAHHILPLILSCLLSENVGERTTSRLGDACKVRDYAARVLASAIDAFDDSINNIHHRTSQKLSDCLEKDTPFVVKYGAVRGLEALKMTKVEAVTKLLNATHQEVEDKIASLASTSLSYQQGVACSGLIKEVLEKSSLISESPNSPLAKRARKEECFF